MLKLSGFKEIQKRNNMKLECPHCHYTLEVSEWNKQLESSVLLGRADKAIPLELETDNWEQYRSEHGGIVDCPECGDVCIFDDMEAY